MYQVGIKGDDKICAADTLYTLPTTPNSQGPDVVYGSYTLTEPETDIETENFTERGNRPRRRTAQ